MNTTEFKIDFQKSSTIDDFNKYSGTNFNKAKKFLDLTLQNIPEWNDYRFKLFYSGYAGFIIIDEYGDKIGYLRLCLTSVDILTKSVGKCSLMWYPNLH